MQAIHTPDWVKQAIFYQIFPDRFAKSARLTKPNGLEPWDADPTTYGYKGGDLLGVVEHLDWIQDLGATALYFNPIFQSASNHRYHTHDYYQVDPLLGGNDAFRVLLDEAHRRGMQVVLDGVFNHASRGFFYFNDILENGDASPWLDWFVIHGPYPINAYDPNHPYGYECWVNLPALPRLNTDNPQVREYIMQVAEYWLRQGIDGWRLDVPFEIKTPGFWQEFRQRVKSINPEAYIVGEVWWDSRQWLQGDQFDAVMNYLFTEAAIAYCGGDRVRRDQVVDRSYYPYPALNAAQYADKIDHLLALYPWEIQLAQMNLLDSHDTARLISIVDGDLDTVRLGLLLMMTYPGAASIYYGDEIGLEGPRPDCMCRKTMPWDHPERWNLDLLQYYKSAIALRKAHPALRTGRYQRLAPAPDSGEGAIYAFARQDDSESLLVAANATEQPQRAVVPLAGLFGENLALRPLFGSGQTEPVHQDTVIIHLPPRSGAVFGR